jgi:hypothetical protein
VAQINEKLKKLLTDVGEVVDVNNRDSSVWSLPQNKNVLIVKHKALEKISAHLGMWFDMPTIIESDTEKNVVSLCVKGYIEDGKGKNSAWSIGEVSPKNTTNKYPYAMAEKRAIDRVILKLLGVHGDFYSQSEADEFDQQDVKVAVKPKKEESITELAKENELVKEVKKEFPNAEIKKDFGETKFFVDLEDKEQRIDTKEKLVETMKGYVNILNGDYNLSLELYEKNKELFLLYEKQDSQGYADLMKWIGNNTKKEKN